MILHGLFGASDNWVSIARSLSNRFTVLLPDLRNHGRSPHSDIHDYDSLSSDIYELANDLDTGNFFLAGHSMGGRVAMKFALRWPEKILGLAIADISPVASPVRDEKVKEQHCEILNTILECNLTGIRSRSEVNSFLESRIGSEKTRELIMKNLQRNADNSFAWKINASSLLKNIDRIMEGITLTESGYYQVKGFPVLFLKGENSDYLPEADFREILRIFPAAEFITIPHAGHWIHADNPVAVRESLLMLAGYD